MDEEQRIEAITQVLSTIFTSQKILRTLAPEFKWAGMGNLLGDYGECVSMAKYGLIKAPAGSSGFDATTSDGRTVQIKANHAAKMVGVRGDADLLLVIKVEENGTFEEVYFNSFKAAVEIGYDSKRDNKINIPISKLLKLNDELMPHKP